MEMRLLIRLMAFVLDACIIMKKVILVLIVLFALLLTSCDLITSLEDKMNNVQCGGVVDNSDKNAPKKIDSKDITSFESYFFLYGQLDSSGDRQYYFSISENDNGKLVLKDRRADDSTSVEVDKSIFETIQEIIDNNELVKLNGIDKHTSGLPAEYQPCYLKATYASGESLYFSQNNNPNAKWAKEVRDYLAQVFHEHGNDTYMLPESASKVVRFELTYTDGDKKYKFNELQVPNEGIKKSFEELVESGYADGEYHTVIDSEVFSRTNSDERERKKGMPSDEYYKGLQKIIKEVNIDQFANGSSFPTNFDYKNTQEYFQFYIEYEYGNTIMGFSDDLLTNEKAKPCFAKFNKYIQEYIDSHIIES